MGIMITCVISRFNNAHYIFTQLEVKIRYYCRFTKRLHILYALKDERRHTEYDGINQDTKYGVTTFRVEGEMGDIST